MIEPREPTPEITKRIDRCLHELGELCESVRIFVTYQTEDGEAVSSGHTAGCGNEYAQLGQIQEWLDTEREKTKLRARENWDDEE